MKATNNVMEKLAKRMDWALMALVEMVVAGASGSAPSNEVFCSNIRSKRTFVKSEGSG